jgi:DNA-binding transcriptional LysR family regulator
MELRQLEYFVAVAEARHFTKAADEKLISQSGLSASIRALERELGAALFARNTRSVELTAAGRALLTEARHALAAAAAARDAVAEVQGVLRGRLSVGLEQCLGVVDVPALLAQFRAAHPGVEIFVQQGGSRQMLDQLATHRLDVAFVATGGQRVDGVELRTLTREPMVLICHPEHWLATVGPVPLQKVRDEAFIDFAPEWGAREISDRARAAADVPGPVTIEVNDVHTLLALVEYGLGIALVPQRIAGKPGRHATVPIADGEAEDCQVSVAVPAGPRPSPAAAALIRLLPNRD